MPHICTRCKNQLEAASGQAPRCPVCGGTKFSFISAKKEERVSEKENTKNPDSQVVSDVLTRSDHAAEVHSDEKEVTVPDINESIESIRIIEPGRYNLNLIRLAESDDRVISLGADGKYRLDLHSMIRKKKNR